MYMQQRFKYFRLPKTFFFTQIDLSHFNKNADNYFKWFINLGLLIQRNHVVVPKRSSIFFLLLTLEIQCSTVTFSSAIKYSVFLIFLKCVTLILFFQFHGTFQYVYHLIKIIIILTDF
jgi:hypothetical protein